MNSGDNDVCLRHIIIIIILRPVPSMELLGVQHIGKLALSIPHHGRLLLQVDVGEFDPRLWWKRGVAVRCDVRKAARSPCSRVCRRQER